jgi:hypothetical protein
MIVAIVVAFFVGVVAVSIIIVILAVKLLDKGLDALDALILRHSIPCRPSRLETCNQIRDCRRYSKPEINPPNNFVYPHSIPYKIRILLITMSQRNSPFKEALTEGGSKNQFCQKNDAKPNKKSSRYLAGYPPVKHMVSILDRLKRAVNQSGKEPRNTLLTGFSY